MGKAQQEDEASIKISSFEFAKYVLSGIIIGTSKRIEAQEIHRFFGD